MQIAPEILHAFGHLCISLLSSNSSLSHKETHLSTLFIDLLSWGRNIQYWNNLLEHASQIPILHQFLKNRKRKKGKKKVEFFCGKHSCWGLHKFRQKTTYSFQNCKSVQGHLVVLAFKFVLAVQFLRILQPHRLLGSRLPEKFEAWFSLA